MVSGTLLPTAQAPAAHEISLAVYQNDQNAGCYIPEVVGMGGCGS
jgi:hypothetical protein